MALLGQLGRRWYQAAFRLLPGPVPANVAVISEMPERFNDARRILGRYCRAVPFRSPRGLVRDLTCLGEPLAPFWLRVDKSSS